MQSDADFTWTQEYKTVEILNEDLTDSPEPLALSHTTIWTLLCISLRSRHAHRLPVRPAPTINTRDILARNRNRAETTTADTPASNGSGTTRLWDQKSRSQTRPPPPPLGYRTTKPRWTNKIYPRDQTTIKSTGINCLFIVFYVFKYSSSIIACTTKIYKILFFAVR